MLWWVIFLNIWWSWFLGIGIVLCILLLIFSVKLVICWLLVSGNCSLFLSMCWLGLWNFRVIWVWVMLVCILFLMWVCCSCIGCLVVGVISSGVVVCGWEIGGDCVLVG